MSGRWGFLKSVSNEDPGETQDGKWDLLELLPAAILFSIALYALGCLVIGVSILIDPGSFGSSESNFGMNIWLAITSATEWATIESAAFFLGALLLSWWLTQRWSEEKVSDENRSVARVHVRRLSALARGLQIGIVCTCVFAIAAPLAYGGEANFSQLNATEWGEIIGRILIALGVIVLAIPGLMIADKILYVRPTTEDITPVTG